MNKAIFLDRDGTINADKAYLSKIEDFEYLPGAIEGLKLLQNAGYKLIIITNQSGIARGYYKNEDFLKLNEWMLNDLNGKGVKIDRVYYCPHHPMATIEKYRIDCDCRKPKLGMYMQAIADFDVDLSKSYSIGDKIRDLSVCHDSKCRGFLISDLEEPVVINSVLKGNYKNIIYTDNLLSAAKEIIKDSIDKGKIKEKSLSF